MSILEQASEVDIKEYYTIIPDSGGAVKIVDGPFEGFSGLVEEVDEINSRLKVSVSIFGRATPVELEYGQVQKQT